MTVSLFTGAPGHGKTLSAVAELVAREIPSGRAIWVNIDGFDLARFPSVQWLDDPTAWHTFPHGALIVVDEAQHWFPTRHFSKPVPAHVAALAEHRHQAHDVWLITQHPSLLDSFARHMVGRHVHMLRAFNLQATTRYEWQVCNDDPTPGQSVETAVRSRVRFDKRLFELYRSAVAHDARLRLPWRYIGALGGALALVVGGVGFAWFSFFAPNLAPAAVAAVEVQPGAGGDPWAEARAAGCAWVFVSRDTNRAGGGVVLVDLAGGRLVTAFGPVAGEVCRFERQARREQKSTALRR